MLIGYKFGLAYRTLSWIVLDAKAREILFMIIHNIVANKERVYRCNMAASPNCPVCDILQDNAHLFSECVTVREAWFWVRQRLLDLLPVEAASTSNFELLNLMFVSSMFDREIIWLLGVYVGLVWNNFVCKSKFLNQNLVKVECSQRYLSHHSANKPLLAHIVGLFQ